MWIADRQKVIEQDYTIRPTESLYISTLLFIVNRWTQRISIGDVALLTSCCNSRYNVNKMPVWCLTVFSCTMLARSNVLLRAIEPEVSQIHESIVNIEIAFHAWHGALLEQSGLESCLLQSVLVDRRCLSHIRLCCTRLLKSKTNK